MKVHQDCRYEFCLVCVKKLVKRLSDLYVNNSLDFKHLECHDIASTISASRSDTQCENHFLSEVDLSKLWEETRFFKGAQQSIYERLFFSDSLRKSFCCEALGAKLGRDRNRTI